jgi:hypothetical protein
LINPDISSRYTFGLHAAKIATICNFSKYVINTNLGIFYERTCSDRIMHFIAILKFIPDKKPVQGIFR